MRRFPVVLCLAFAACSPNVPTPAAKLWTVKDFLERGCADTCAGFKAEDLVRQEGEELVFFPRAQAKGPGLTLFPAVAEGKPASFVVTEIWWNTPDPWVQPVYLPRNEVGQPVDGANSVFPVDVASTFYSPYWRSEEVRTPNLTDTTYRSAKDVLDGARPLVTGSIIFCPIVPSGTTFARDGEEVLEVVTLTPATLKPTPPTAHPGWLPRGIAEGWVDGRTITYFDFGLDHAPADGQVVFEADAYFFVDAKDRTLLPVATVLPAEPVRHALIRRNDVVLPKTAGVFFPPNRAETRLKVLSRLQDRVQVPELSDPFFNGFGEYAFRVALNPECFTSTTFPGDCQWLDSEARVRAAMRSDLIVRKPVQLGIGVVLP